MARTPKSAAEPPTSAARPTQRAYTLRLRGVDPNDHSWREALWATHEAVNRGAKVFGDWLLTLRGGLSHELTEQKVVEGKGDKKKERDPTDAERRDRRILLALSWLSVESAPTNDDPRKQFLIPCGNGLANREQALREALRNILSKRKLPDSEIGDPQVDPENQPDTWLGHCGPSLAARIRVDAAWVNRSEMFDEATTDWNSESARKDAHTLLSFILSDEFLTLPTSTKPKKNTEDAGEGDEQEERQRAVKASSRGAGQRTRHPFSHLLGEGKPFGKPSRKLILRDKWHGYIKPKLEAIGIPVVDAQSKSKGKKKNSGPAHTELQREMLSKAASRVAQIVTKQRQQEADRLARKEADAELRKMEADTSYSSALSVLRTYCDEYRVTSEATGEFQIRSRQVAGWDRVLKQWSSVTESDPERAREARIEAVKAVQESDEEKKFGDANLFFRLAEDRFTPVWCRDSNTDPTILERFVKGMNARGDSERLKVAAFRHPDPYQNPIFCQFGVSRPAIHFRRLKAFTDDPGGNDPRAVGMLLWHPACNSAKLTLLHGVSQRLDREIGSACDQVQPSAEDLRAVSRRGRLGAAAGGLPNADSPTRVAGVFDLKKIRSRSTDDEQEDAGDNGNELGKLKEPKWNGTLSTGRRELGAIRKLIDKGDMQKANRRRDQLRWTLTVSMEMEARGPWFRYVAAAQDQTPFVRTARKDKPKDKNDLTKGLAESRGDKRIEAEGWPWQEFNKPLKDSKDGTALVEDMKAARGDKACLIFSRLPGLRVLSVDLGHRFAAACAVWESLPLSAMKQETEGRAIVAGGIGENEPYCHTRHIDERGKERTTVYRRIGADKLSDGSEHPAPWARLDRQFFIKLQGEERPARAASNKPEHGINETAIVAGLAKALGLLREDTDTSGSRSVDELMRRVVRMATLGLKRQGRRAKIAYAFKPDCPGIPGMGGTLTTITRGDDAHIRFLTDALMDWHALAVDTDWDGSAARQLWNQHIKPAPCGVEIGKPTPPDPNAERPTRQQRRNSEDELREKLKPIAKHFAQADPTPNQGIHEEWATAWNTDDGTERTKDDFEHTLSRNESGRVIGSRTTPKKGKESPGGWHEHLRAITDWVMGWHLPGTESKRWNRNVGGLSLTRIATMRVLYQLHKAFAMRPRPDKVQGAPERGESNAGVAQSILDAMERMRDQRVKQIASRIVEAALGVGIERDRVRDEVKEKWRYPKRPRGLLYHVDDKGVAYGDPQFKTCHAVVIENLRSYRPDELQTRRENRALMNWSAGKVRKYLEEACQLHGLHLREVMPNYTSRQCSRTGLPGVRCDDVPIDEFLTAPWWNKAVNAAQKRRKANGTDSMDGLLVALGEKWSKARNQEKSRQRTLRLPRAGGDLFVVAPPQSCGAKVHSPCPLCRSGRAVQADLNAAANIGLRALLDPDFPGKWWYVPCIEDKAAGTATPRADKVKGSACFGSDPAKREQFGSLVNPSSGQVQADNARRRTRGNARRTGSDAKDTTNFWSDLSATGLRNAADGGFWLPTPAYWRWVRKRVVAAFWDQNGLGIARPDLDPDGDP